MVFIASRNKVLPAWSIHRGVVGTGTALLVVVVLLASVVVAMWTSFSLTATATASAPSMSMNVMDERRTTTTTTTSGTTTTVTVTTHSLLDLLPRNASSTHAKPQQSDQIHIHRNNMTNKSNSPSSSKPDMSNTSIAVIAYVISITKCDNEHQGWFYDAAVVLKRSIDQSSYPIHATSRYASKMYAIVHTYNGRRSACHTQLERAGYHILPSIAPLLRNDYSNAFLRDNVKNDGCCGLRENLKLHVYNLLHHPIAVHLDMDSILFQPLDELFDAMYYPPTHPQGRDARRHLVQSKLLSPTYQPAVPISKMTINAFYTKFMTRAYFAHAPGVNGGFLVVRPDTHVYDHMIRLQKEATYIPGVWSKGTGWYGSNYGSHIWGSLTIQGFLSYYYSLVANTTSVELHRCKFNQMADNPRESSCKGDYRAPTPRDPKAAGYSDMRCKDGRQDCDDVQCQTWPFSQVRSGHYTFCSKPWTCPDPMPGISIHEESCKTMFREWFRIRHQSAATHNLLTAQLHPNGTFHPDVYFGYCREVGPGGYVSMDDAQHG